MVSDPIALPAGQSGIGFGFSPQTGRVPSPKAFATGDRQSGGPVRKRGELLREGRLRSFRCCIGTAISNQGWQGQDLFSSVAPAAGWRVRGHYETALLLLQKHSIFPIVIKINLLILLFAFIVISGCHKNTPDTLAAPAFATTPFSKKINPGIIDEASGIADSKANPGYLWVEQDSGNPNDLFLLSDSGQVLKKINIKSAVNRDWEDIALADGPSAGVNYLYVADIGDNNKTYIDYTIYRFPEPSSTIDSVISYEVIKFRYPDGPHDAEAILVDNGTKDIYIITKQDAMSRIFKLPYPQSTSGTNTAIYDGSLSFTGAVSAAVSPTGELLIKTYTSLYYWKKTGNETMEAMFQKEPVIIAYQQEAQGEGTCFKNDNSGFYTLSERPSVVSSVSLNFYRRN